MTMQRLGLMGALILVVAAATIFVVRHGSGAPARNTFSKTEWKFHGYQDPKSTVLSVSAVALEGDGQAVIKSITPELRKRLEFDLGPTMREQGRTLAQLLASYAPRIFGQNTGIRFVEQKFLGDDRALIKVHFDGGLGDHSLVLKKMNQEWKLDDFQ
jgi:hypothetical protein